MTPLPYNAAAEGAKLRAELIRSVCWNDVVARALLSAYEAGAKAALAMAAEHVRSHIGNGWTGPPETQLHCIAKNLPALAQYVGRAADPGGDR